jgi:class 3 adenylate cyclase/tetratricopeptide (TPR) repeat protein
MKCSKCGFENPDGFKFCNGCGGKLVLICPSCQTTNPPGSRFCGECGHNLTVSSEPTRKELSFDEKITKIQKYLPEGLTEKILSQRDRIEGEKRQVTVMFCDMEGYTSISEKLGPEGVYTLMDQVYEILIHKVNDFGGTVNELTGDGIMALFGAPIALEDAPQRAIRSALSIHKEITRFSERLSAEKGIPPIRMRAGINSGPVVIGTVGNNLRVDFKAIGDTVNLASRMESIAEPGTTYVTEDTFKLTEGLFRFENLGEREIKGKKAPIRVYRVLAPSSRRTRFDVSAERGLTSFVGRERELELLLDAFERAKEGNGQAFSIIGEAGIGKSRFLYEFRKAVSNEDITFLEGKCLSYGKGVPYHAMIDVLKGNFNIGDDETEDGIRKKIEESLKVLKVEEAKTVPYLLELLGVKDSGIDRMSMSPEGLKERIIEAVRQTILKGAEIRPLVIAIEDLHWADQSTEHALKWLLESVPGANVLVLFTYRPEFVHTWGGRSYHNQITLNRLSNRESLLMVSHFLGTEAVDPELQKLIVSKTEGVPFFIEEFVKSLQGLKMIKTVDGRVLLQGVPQSLTIPSTIQDIIMARVDRLPDAAKAVLQTGSVIEREFSHDLILRAVGLPEPELLMHFTALTDAELLYERGIYPRSSYIFRHALTREVVYASILDRRRRELHGQIGTAIEELCKDDIAEHYEVLSEHFCQSEDYAKAAEYAKRSARKAEKSASLPDAITHARKRVLYLEKLPDSGDGGRELIDARTALGLYLAQINHFVEARKAVESVARLAREKGYRKRLGQIQIIMGCYYGFIKEDFPKGLEALEEAFCIASEEWDLITLILASMWLGLLQAFDCDFEKARSSLQRAVDINVAANSLWGIAIAKSQLAWFCYFCPGTINSLEELSSEALKLAEESGDPISRGNSQITYGISCYAKGHLEDVKCHILEGTHLCGRAGMYGWEALGYESLAETYFELKDYHKSKENYDRGSRILEAAQIQPSWVRWAQLGVTRCSVMLGEGVANLESLRAIPRGNRVKLAEGWTCRFLGEILVNLGGSHVNEAEHWIRKAIEADERNGMRFHLGLDYALYGKFFSRQKDRAQAQVKLGMAVEILKECGADGWVTKYEEEIAKFA